MLPSFGRSAVPPPLEEKIGHGTFSEVYRSVDPIAGRPCAVKRIDLHKIQFMDQARIMNEVEIHREASRNCPWVIKFLHFAANDDYALMYLEHAPNDSLFFFIDPEKGLPEALALRFFYQAALAVQHLHSTGIIHRDIKPENLLLDANFNLKLCDFGWSCRENTPDQRELVCGTYAYMAPEIVFNLPHGRKADIWCLGVLLVELLTGSPPFRGESLPEMVRELGLKNPQIEKPISPKTQSLLNGLLERDQEKRLSIDDIMAHSAIKTRRQQFEKRLTKQQFMTLVSNYMVNKKIETLGDLPESILRMTESPFEEDPKPVSKNRSLGKERESNASWLFKETARPTWLPKGGNTRSMINRSEVSPDPNSRREIKVGDMLIRIKSDHKHGAKVEGSFNTTSNQSRIDRLIDLSVETKKERKNPLFDGPKRLGVPPMRSKRDHKPAISPSKGSHPVKSDFKLDVPQDSQKMELTRVNSKSLKDFLTKTKTSDNGATRISNVLVPPELEVHGSNQFLTPHHSSPRQTPNAGQHPSQQNFQPNWLYQTTLPPPSAMNSIPSSPMNFSNPNVEEIAYSRPPTDHFSSSLRNDLDPRTNMRRNEVSPELVMRVLRSPKQNLFASWKELNEMPEARVSQNAQIQDFQQAVSSLIPARAPDMISPAKNIQFLSREAQISSFMPAPPAYMPPPESAPAKYLERNTSMDQVRVKTSTRIRLDETINLEKSASLNAELPNRFKQRLDTNPEMFNTIKVDPRRAVNPRTNFSVERYNNGGIQYTVYKPMDDVQPFHLGPLANPPPPPSLRTAPNNPPQESYQQAINFRKYDQPVPMQAGDGSRLNNFKTLYENVKQK